MNLQLMQWPQTLHRAAQKGNLKRIQQLIENGTDINQTGDRSETALHLAVQDNQAETVQFLLDNKATDDCAGGDTEQRKRAITDWHANRQRFTFAPNQQSGDVDLDVVEGNIVA